MNNTKDLEKINNQNHDIDYKKISLYLKIGILGAIIVLAGDFIMGWGLKDMSLSGIESAASQYLNVSDVRMLLSALCGLIGVPIAVLGHYGIFKMLNPYSKKYAKLYKIGMLGFLSCGGAGVHVASVGAAYFYKYMNMADPANALTYSMKYISYFLIPLYLIVIISWIIMVYAHIRVILCKCSPYSRYCLFASMVVGTVITALFGLIGNYEIINALMMGAFSVGNVWTLIGHYIILINTRKNSEIKK